VHLNHGTAEDLALLAENHATLTVCPRSAASKRTGYPLLRNLERHRVSLSLGTDWSSTDMLEEMRFVGSLPYLFSNLPEFSSTDILRMATINGARALGMGEETGSIEPGKRADLVLFALRPLHASSLGPNADTADLARLLLTRLTHVDISRVIAGGNTVFQEGAFLTLDEAGLVTQVREIEASLPGISAVADSVLRRGKIIPFMAAPPSRAAGAEGFEEGFTVRHEPAPQPAPVPRPATPPATTSKPSPQTKHPHQEREVRKPELSKNVRLEFGDDDDSSPGKGG
jgi:hypothetical protein